MNNYKRWVCVDENFMDKSVDDLFYGYLLQKAHLDMKSPTDYSLFIKEGDMKNLLRGEAIQIFGCSKKTLQRKLDIFLERNLLILKDGKYVVPQVNAPFSYIDTDTIDYMIKNKIVGGIKIYCYFKNKIYNKSSYNYTYRELLRQFGYSEKYNSPKGIDNVRNPIDALKKEGLIVVADEKLAYIPEGNDKDYTVNYFVLKEVKDSVTVPEAKNEEADKVRAVTTKIREVQSKEEFDTEWGIQKQANLWNAKTKKNCRFRLKAR